MRIAIIGGGVGGTTLAFQLRKRNKEAEIYIIEASEHTEYSPCSMPYTISNNQLSLDGIYVFKEEDYEQNNIKLIKNTRVEDIFPSQKKLKLQTNSTTSELFYDKLVIATGGHPFIPPIKGLDKVKYSAFTNIDNAREIIGKLGNNKRYAIIGGGFIGVEVAYSLAEKGKTANLIEAKESILPGILDKDMARNVQEYLKDKINLLLNKQVREVKENLIILDDKTIDYDSLIITAGTRANKDIAERAGLEVDNGILIDKKGKTSEEDIFALGDCAQLKDAKMQPAQLASIATIQAEALSRTILGEETEFPKPTNASITKIGNVFVASVGMNSQQIEGRAISGKYSGKTKEDFIPNAKDISVKILAEEDGKLLGAQIIGEEEVLGRIDVLSLAFQKGMSIYDLAEAETAYHPFCAPIFDPIVLAAKNAIRKLEFLKTRRKDR